MLPAAFSGSLKKADCTGLKRAGQPESAIGIQAALACFSKY
nr:hypothetical protein [uncultured Kingella sp.]